MLGEQQTVKLSKEEEAEQGLRESLEDVVLVAGKLKSYCRSVDEMLAMVQAALADNGGGQLRLIGTLLFGGKK